jgi:RecA-family ATPase
MTSCEPPAGSGHPLRAPAIDVPRIDVNRIVREAAARARSAAQAAQPLRLPSPADCAGVSRWGYVVKGLIAMGDVLVVYGAPGTGKSVLVPHLAFAVAMGRPVFGRRTRAGRVLYVATEDTHGMAVRIAALLREQEAQDEAADEYGPAPDAFALVVEKLDLMNPADQQRLLEAVRDHRADLVAIDTLAAGFAGMVENGGGPDGMGAAARFLRRLADEGPAVAAVQHSPKHRDMPRGWSGLAGTRT